MILSLFFFIWTAGGLFNVAYAAYNEIQKPAVNQKQEQRSEEKFQKTIEDIKNIIQDKDVAESKSLTSKISDLLETKRSKLKAKRDAIDSVDIEIKNQFAETEKKLKKAGLPQEILQRHYNFVKHYEDNLKELRTNLDAADKAKTKTEFDTQIQKINQHLEKVAPPKRHKALDPNKLPHRVSDLKRKEPRTKPEEFQKDLKQRANFDIPSDKTFEAVSFRSEARNLDFLRFLTSVRNDIRADYDTLSQTGIQPSAVIPVEAGIQSELTNKQPLLLASNGSLEGILESLPKVEKQLLPPPIILAQAPNPPTDADLAESIDVQLTPAIKAKAQELNYSPVKIYNWVRNNIEYVPTYGSIQGADMCLQTLQGNDFDIASLLIALFRVSGIHARYVQGTIELPIEKVMNWVGGFTDANAALDFIASGGTPVAGIISGGKISSVRMEHVWVEAYINYYPLRGAAHKTGKGDTWIPLDASFKQYTYTQGIDIKSAVPFDAQTFVNQIESTATIDQTNSSVTNINSSYIQQQMQNYQTQVKNYIDQNYPNATVGDVLGKKEIIKQEFTYLLGTLPYRKSIVGVKYSEILDSLRHRITFSVTKDIYDSDMGTPINITKSLPEIAGKKITLSYSPATTDDEAVINSYLPQPHPDGSPIQPNELPTSLPAYLINLKPELKIDGVVVATGTAVGMGYQETFEMVFKEPGPAGNTDIVSNQINVGAYYATAIHTGKIPSSHMAALKTKLEILKAKLEANDLTSITKDDVIGEILHLSAVTYYTELDAINYILSRNMNVACSRLPSESIFASELRVETMFGIPKTASIAGLEMDVDRSLNILKAIDGNKSKEFQFMLATGMNSSALEHAVPEQLFSTQEYPAMGISAVKAIKLANDQGIPVYTINQSNINAILPQLQVDADVKTEIQNAVNTGKEVTVSKTNITLDGWTGCGYIINDPNTGAGAYMISGGFAGGFLIGLIAGILAKNGIICLIIAGVAGVPAWVALLGAFLLGLAIGFVLAQILSADEKADLNLMLTWAIRNAILPFLAALGATVVWIIAFIALLVALILPYITYIPIQKKQYYANFNEHYRSMVAI